MVKEVEANAVNFPAERQGEPLNAFGLKLLQLETAFKPQRNVFISPLSVFLALAMIENGAGGETRAAMREALGFPANATEGAVNNAAAGIVKSLSSLSGASLDIANALWVNVGITNAQEFMQVCRDIYGAEARTLDLSHPSASVAINQWVSEKTRGTIRQIVTPADIPAAIAVVTNAVYFRGTFRIPFLKELTEPEPFHLANGRDKLVPMMRRERQTDLYRHGKKFEAAELHYRDCDMALLLLLPAKGVAPEDVLMEGCLSDLSVEDNSDEVVFVVPRFTIEFQGSLTQSLSRMGMGRAFEPGADFAAIGSNDLFLSEVVHQTYLEVDEQGTIAAAITDIGVCLSAYEPDPPEPKTLVFDRPFAVLLKDTQAKTTLFAGVVYEP